MKIFTPNPEFIVYETSHWLVNQRQDATLPGYMIVGAKDSNATSLDLLVHDALAEMGIVLANVVKAIESCLNPIHVYICRFGHAAGHTFHFHVIPVFSWVKEAYDEFDRGPGSTIKYPSWSDGPILTLFVSEEFAQGRSPCQIKGVSVESAIVSLRELLSISSPVQSRVDYSVRASHP